MVGKQKILYYAAAAATGIAGIIHLYMAPNSLGFNLNTGILFLIGGIAQLFWIIPTIKRWGTPWYAIGIGGTGVFIAIWAITRMPENMITGRGGSINQNGIIVEIMQAAFIALNMAILIYEKRKDMINKSNVANAK
ncbi:MAG: hypothetical protein HZC29_07985 [Thaumarchaeota archaeon]|nr:hypothetical protein [Nitrososphaerota archaeon]